MATAATTLWKTATLKDWVGITDPSDISQDKILERIADSVTASIERYTRRVFVIRALTETRDGDGSKELFLYQYPVSAFTSLSVLRSPTDAAAELLSSGDYLVNLKTGRVWLHSDRLSEGIGNVTAVYSAGYGAQEAATVPQDIVTMGLELVKLIYTEKAHGAIAASSINIGANNFMIKPEWPKQIKQTLDDWRRPY